MILSNHYLFFILSIHLLHKRLLFLVFFSLLYVFVKRIVIFVLFSTCKSKSIIMLIEIRFSIHVHVYRHRILNPSYQDWNFPGSRWRFVTDLNGPQIRRLSPTLVSLSRNRPKRQDFPRPRRQWPLWTVRHGDSQVRKMGSIA